MLMFPPAWMGSQPISILPRHTETAETAGKDWQLLDLLRDSWQTARSGLCARLWQGLHG